MRVLLSAVVGVLVSPAGVFGQTSELDEIQEARRLLTEAQQSMFASPEVALNYAERADDLLRTVSFTQDDSAQELNAQAEWLQAEALSRLGDYDTAQQLLNALEEQLQTRAISPEFQADVLSSLSRNSRALGDYEIAFQAAIDAYQLHIDARNARGQAISLLQIGSIYLDAGRHAEAIEYFDQAIERFDDIAISLAAMNNGAEALRSMGNSDEAVERYLSALELAESMQSDLLVARIQSNIANLYIEIGDVSHAETYIMNAEQVFASNDGPGFNYWSRFLYGLSAKLSKSIGNMVEAKEYIDLFFNDIDVENTDILFLEFHDLAFDVYRSQNELNESIRHLVAYQRLDQQMRDIAASANSALLAAQFEFAEQELEIEQLRSESLAQDLLLTQERGRYARIANFSFLSLLIALLAIALFAYRGVAARRSALAKALYVHLPTGLATQQALERQLKIEVGLPDPGYLCVISLPEKAQLATVLGAELLNSWLKTIGDRLKIVGGVKLVSIMVDGDIGLLVHGNYKDELGLAALAHRVIGPIAGPMSLNKLVVQPRFCIGICDLGDHEVARPDEAVEKAQKAAQQAWLDGELFSAPQPMQAHQKKLNNLSVLEAVSIAEASGALELHYQPKLDIATGKISSLEALMRLHDASIGTVSPATFIELAEITGQIAMLSRWSIRQALEDVSLLDANGYDVKVAVNLSAYLLNDEEFVEYLCLQADKKPHKLIIEVTETAVMQNVERAIASLKKIADNNMIISIDDYGTGQSSLSYLKELPAQEIKLDMAFIKNLDRSKKDRILVKSTIDLAHELNMSVVAEGVELTSTLNILKEMGCDTAQGYGICKPLKVGALMKFLDSGN